MKGYFKDKKITVMGLGLLGRGVGDAGFLAKNGADLTITDLKSRKELKTSLDKLKKFKSVKYIFGKHRLRDFRNRDMILKSASVPLDSIYIKEARKNKIPIEMSASLFAKLSDATIIGVTGTRGKSTVTQMIYEILKFPAMSNIAGKDVFLGGNIRNVSTLALLDKVKKGDIVVMELDSWQLQGFGESKISPHIAVFTNLMRDHMNYYGNSMAKYFQDKANIYKYQKEEDCLIAGKEIAKKIKRGKIKSKLIIPNPPAGGWKLKILGEHNKENAALAASAASAAGVPKKIIKKTLENFKGVEGRLELIKTLRGIKIYNDNNATTQDATIAALRALGSHFGAKRQNEKNIILIIGGADKGLNMSKLMKEIPKHCKVVILLDGTGTEKMQSEKQKMQNNNKKLKIENANSLQEVLKLAMENTKKNDIILFSPAFASLGMFKNEYDRNDQFVEIVKKLK